MRAYNKQEGYGQAFLLGDSKAAEQYMDVLKAKAIAKAEADAKKAKNIDDSFGDLTERNNTLTDNGFHESHAKELQGEMAKLTDEFNQISGNGEDPFRSNSDAAKAWRDKYGKMEFGFKYSQQARDRYNEIVNDAAVNPELVDLEKIQSIRNDLSKPVYELINSGYVIGETPFSNPEFMAASKVEQVAKGFTGDAEKDPEAFEQYLRGVYEVEQAQNTKNVKAFNSLGADVSYVDYMTELSMQSVTYDRGSFISDIANNVKKSKSKVEDGGVSTMVNRAKRGDIMAQIESGLKSNPTALKREMDRMGIAANENKDEAIKKIAKDLFKEVETQIDSEYGRSVTDSDALLTEEAKTSSQTFVTDIRGDRVVAIPGNENRLKIKKQAQNNALSYVTKFNDMKVERAFETSLGYSVTEGDQRFDGISPWGAPVDDDGIPEFIALEVMSENVTESVKKLIENDEITTTTKGDKQIIFLKVRGEGSVPDELLERLHMDSYKKENPYNFEANTNDVLNIGE